jgi:hypothetical protein
VHGVLTGLDLALQKAPAGALSSADEAVVALALIAEWLQRQPQLLDSQFVFMGASDDTRMAVASAIASVITGSKSAAAVAAGLQETGLSSLRCLCTAMWFMCLKLLSELLASGVPDAEATAAASVCAAMAAAAADNAKWAAKALVGEGLSLRACHGLVCYIASVEQVSRCQVHCKVRIQRRGCLTEALECHHVLGICFVPAVKVPAYALLQHSNCAV